MSGRVPSGPGPRDRRGGDPGMGWRGPPSRLPSARGQMTRVVLAPLVRLCEALGKTPPPGGSVEGNEPRSQTINPWRYVPGIYLIGGYAKNPSMPARSGRRCGATPASRCRSASARPRRWPRSPITWPRHSPRPAACYDLPTTDVDQALAGIEVREVWGVGPRWAKWLEGQGIATALDLKRADPKAIRRKMTVVGERLVHELNGQPCLPLELVDAAAAGPHGVPLVRADPDRAPARSRRRWCRSSAGPGRSSGARA